MRAGGETLVQQQPLFFSKTGQVLSIKTDPHKQLSGFNHTAFRGRFFMEKKVDLL